MPRLVGMSKTQKAFMVDYLESHKFLLQQSKLKPSEIEKFKSGWQQFAVELNSLEGAQKNVTQWKDALNEFKVSVRRKARLLHEENCGTGGGPKVQKPLNDLEERLLALLSKIVITGAPDIPEGGMNVEVAAAPNIDEFIVIEEFVPELPPSSPTNDEIVTVLASAPTIKTPQGRKRAATTTPSRNAEMSSIAKEHEKCLLALAASNNNLANAINRKGRKRIASAVLNLKF